MTVAPLIEELRKTIGMGLAQRTALLELAMVCPCSPDEVERLTEGLGVDQIRAVCTRVCQGEELAPAIAAVRVR